MQHSALVRVPAIKRQDATVRQRRLCQRQHWQQHLRLKLFRHLLGASHHVQLVSICSGCSGCCCAPCSRKQHTPLWVPFSSAHVLRLSRQVSNIYGRVCCAVLWYLMKARTLTVALLRPSQVTTQRWSRAWMMSALSSRSVSSTDQHGTARHAALRKSRLCWWMARHNRPVRHRTTMSHTAPRTGWVQQHRHPHAAHHSSMSSGEVPAHACG
jgi:hypothetical protein